MNFHDFQDFFLGKVRQNTGQAACQHAFAGNRVDRLTGITLAKVINIQPPLLYPLEEWVKEQQGKHFCTCGCGNPIQIKPQHRAKGIPKFTLAHHRMSMTRLIKSYNEKGLYTVGQVARMTGIGATSIRRHQGKLFPLPATVHKNSTRLYTKNQIEEIQRCWENYRSPANL
ncbi:MAG: hypothetical protein A2036_02305 [Omnitrophica bacterium GWA2_50_21]|nr:MAG: hypothetical protein A2036_02305 [Omnitrophica bacterium GWA2_50_21]